MSIVVSALLHRDLQHVALPLVRTLRRVIVPPPVAHGRLVGWPAVYVASVSAPPPVVNRPAAGRCQFYGGSVRPFVSSPNGSSNTPMTNAADVSATGVPMVWK